MTRKYKKIIVTTSFLLLFILCLSFLLSFFVNFSGSSNFLINGFAFKNNESLNISLDKEYKFTSKKEINFLDVKVNFFANANYKYEFEGVPCDFIDLYDLESYEKGEGKNINSAFYIKREKDSILFKKNKTLNELIEFYKGDCEFPNYSSLDVDYYRCELVYGDEVTSFTFGDEQNLVILDETEVIF